jgi:hypothetical protein
MDKEETNDPQYRSCVWCGNWISKDTYLKRVERKRDYLDVCKDCLDVRKGQSVQRRNEKNWVHPELGRIYCAIWMKELNDDWLPIDDKGNVVMPGVRICGLKDCVNSNHVIPPKTMQVTDLELLLGMHELQQHNRKSKTR